MARGCVLAAAAVAVLVVAGCNGAPALQVEYSTHGPLSITDTLSGSHFELGAGYGDGVVELHAGSSVIVLSSATLPLIGTRANGSSRTYTYGASGHQLHVVFESQPGWRFLSKRLLVRPAPRTRHRLPPPPTKPPTHPSPRARRVLGTRCMLAADGLGYTRLLTASRLAIAVVAAVAAAVATALQVTAAAGGSQAALVARVGLLNGSVACGGGAGWDSVFTGNQYVSVARCPPDRATGRQPGVFVSVSNPFTQPGIGGGGGGPDLGGGPAAALFTAEYGSSAGLGTGVALQNGTFESDRVVLGPLTLAPGGWIAPRTLGSVNRAAAPPAMLNTAERDALVACVTQFLPPEPARAASTVKVNVAWDENDYQIDLADATMRAEYKRIIDRNAELGVTHMVFAPTNTDLALGDLFVNTDTLLDVGWEYVLWAGFGLGIRNGTWSNAGGIDAAALAKATPASLQEILSHAERRGVKLMAYVYPIIVGFAPMGPDTPWIYPTTNPHVKGHQIHHCDLGNVLYQRWLANALSQFYTAFGLGGFSFDGVFIGDANGHNSTTYGQWKGWMWVLAELRARHPEIVMDNRLSAHAYGPWYQLSGSYSEPIAGDENPETYGIPVPSTHADHVAGDNLRRVNYWYRQASLLPMQRIPGFFSHQTERSAPPAATQVDVCSNSSAPQGRQGCYRRDFDLLGYKYSLMSQVATAGLNNVLCMLPARDPAEFKLFPADDVAFIQRWLNFSDENIDKLANTVPLPSLDQVALGQVDGTAAFQRPLSCTAPPTDRPRATAHRFQHVLGDAEPAGFVWLFNPGYKNASVRLTIDDSLSPFDPCLYTSGGAVTQTAAQFVVAEIFPASRVLATVRLGDAIDVGLDGSSAKALSVTPLADVRVPFLVGGASAGSVTAGPEPGGGTAITIADLLAEPGATVGNLELVLPAALGCRAESGAGVSVRLMAAGASPVHRADAAALRHGCAAARGGGFIRLPLPTVRFAGAPFQHAAEVNLTPSGGNGTVDRYTGSVSVPTAVFEQLKQRQMAYPVPWNKQDADASWLEPHRLLLFLQMNCSSTRQGACDDTMAAKLRIAGKPLAPIRAYETRCTECTNVNHPNQPRKSNRFNGYYWDASALAPNQPHAVELTLGSKNAAALVGLFFENVEPMTTGQVVPLAPDEEGAGWSGLWVADSAGGCSTDDDCSLLGVCSRSSARAGGKCVCDPGWTGPDCAAAALRPYDDVAHLGYVNATRASWGGRPVRVGGEWHLFATEIAARCPLILFMNNSMVIQAQSTTGSPAGPYKHRSIVRDAFAHNPTAIGPTSDGYYLVYSIGGAAAGTAAPNPASWLLDCTAELPPCAADDRCRSHGTPASNGQVVLSYSRDPIRGPWTHRVVLPIGGSGTTPPNSPSAWNCKHNNPSALLGPNDSVVLMYHGSTCDGSLRGERLGLADAPHWNSTEYSKRPGPPIVAPSNGTGSHEDPFLWRDKRGNFHVLTHNQQSGNLCGDSASCGAHLFSRDSRAWSISKHPAYSSAVRLRSNGSLVHTATRQRPQLVFSDDGEMRPVVLTNGASFEGNNGDLHMLTHTLAFEFL